MLEASLISQEGPSGIAPGQTLEPRNIAWQWAQEYISFPLVGFNSHILFKLQLCSPLVLGSTVKIRPEMHIHFLKLCCSVYSSLQVLTKSIDSVMFLLRSQCEPDRLERKPPKSIYPGLGERENFRRHKPESSYNALYMHFHLLLFVFVCMSCVKLTVNVFIYMAHDIAVADIYCCNYYL